MTPVYPSRVDVWSLCGFVVDGKAPSKRLDDDDDDDAVEEGDLPPELLLYTNIKPVTMVTMRMPLTPWHWRDT